MKDLATCQFVAQARRLLFIGPPSTGKSHLAQAIGHHAIRQAHPVLRRSAFDLVRDLAQDQALAGEDKLLDRYLNADLLVIDDMGPRRIPGHAGGQLSEIIMRRHEVRSTTMTSNRPLQEWGKLLEDVPAAGAILDRVLQHA